MIGPINKSVNFIIPFENIESFNTLVITTRNQGCSFYVGHFQSGKTSALQYLVQTKSGWIYVDSNGFGGTKSSILKGLCEIAMLNDCDDLLSLDREIYF